MAMPRGRLCCPDRQTVFWGCCVGPSRLFVGPTRRDSAQCRAERPRPTLCLLQPSQACPSRPLNLRNKQCVEKSDKPVLCGEEGTYLGVVGTCGLVGYRARGANVAWTPQRPYLPLHSSTLLAPSVLATGEIQPSWVDRVSPVTPSANQEHSSPSSSFSPTHSKPAVLQSLQEALLGC